MLYSVSLFMRGWVRTSNGDDQPQNYFPKFRTSMPSRPRIKYHIREDPSLRSRRLLASESFNKATKDSHQTQNCDTLQASWTYELTNWWHRCFFELQFMPSQRLASMYRHSDYTSECSNTGGRELKQSVLPRRQHSKCFFNGTHFTSLPSSLSSPWGLRLLPFLLPSLPCWWTLVNRKRYLGNAEVTQDKLPWAGSTNKLCIAWHVLQCHCGFTAWPPLGRWKWGLSTFKVLIFSFFVLMLVLMRILTCEHFCLKIHAPCTQGCVGSIVWYVMFCAVYT